LVNINHWFAMELQALLAALAATFTAITDQPLVFVELVAAVSLLLVRVTLLVLLHAQHVMCVVWANSKHRPVQPLLIAFVKGVLLCLAPTGLPKELVVHA